MDFEVLNAENFVVLGRLVFGDHVEQPLNGGYLFRLFPLTEADGGLPRDFEQRGARGRIERLRAAILHDRDATERSEIELERRRLG